MPELNLSGQQRMQLNEALGRAFSLPRLRELLDYRLEKRLEDITLGGDYQQIRFELIKAAEAQGWTMELLVAAREENPGNALLVAFAQGFGLSAATLAQEREIRRQSPFFDVAKFRTRVGEIESQVCRIEFPTAGGTVYGSGFLVSPSAVMTNYHVMEHVITGAAERSSVIFRFDYKALDGLLINDGTRFGLADDDWLIDSSPLSPIDLEADPKTAAPSAQELDYAVVRLDGTPGIEPIGKGDEQSPPRGWVDLHGATPISVGDPMFVVQHPSSRPLKLAMEMDGVIGLFADATRVRHRVNTEPGSSGSPCFNREWELVALHHVGDPNFTASPTFNEAITIQAINLLLEQHGQADKLVAEEA